jgi:hypothetical protein
MMIARKELEAYERNVPWHILVTDPWMLGIKPYLW